MLPLGTRTPQLGGKAGGCPKPHSTWDIFLKRHCVLRLGGHWIVFVTEYNQLFLRDLGTGAECRDPFRRWAGTQRPARAGGVALPTPLARGALQTWPEADTLWPRGEVQPRPRPAKGFPVHQRCP